LWLSRINEIAILTKPENPLAIMAAISGELIAQKQSWHSHRSIAREGDGGGA
jgi:hypothetical protein